MLPTILPMDPSQLMAQMVPMVQMELTQPMEPNPPTAQMEPMAQIAQTALMVQNQQTEPMAPMELTLLTEPNQLMAPMVLMEQILTPQMALSPQMELTQPMALLNGMVQLLLLRIIAIITQVILQTATAARTLHPNNLTRVSSMVLTNQHLKMHYKDS